MLCVKREWLADSTGDHRARGSARHGECLSIIIVNLVDNHPRNG
jgi:hypothetical protein